MPPPAATDAARPSDRAARLVKRHFLWLLLACYALAALWPMPGLALRNWRQVTTFAGDAPLVPLILLAVLLFAAALLADVTQIRSVLRHPGVLLAALGAVWLPPALLVLLAGWLVPWVLDGHATAGILVGLTLIAAMPVANSSVGWVQHADGNLALGAALVVLSISLCPWITPSLLRLLAASLSPKEQQLSEALVHQFSGWFFIVWVILPTAAGLACRLAVGPRRLAAAAGAVTLTSAAALLLLNYINSALALPRVLHVEARLLITTALLAVALSAVGLAAAWALARLMQLADPTRDALVFGLSMKHTGLALILAGAVLVDQPHAILMIVLATLAQHALAGVVQWWLRPCRVRPNEIV